MPADAPLVLADLGDQIGEGVGNVVETVLNFVFDDVLGPVLDFVLGDLLGGLIGIAASLGGLIGIGFLVYFFLGDDIAAWWKKFRASESGQETVATARSAAERIAVAVEKAGAAVADAVAEARTEARPEGAFPGKDREAPSSDSTQAVPRADPEQRLIAAAAPAGIDATLFSASEHGRAVLASLIRLSGYAQGYQGVRFGGPGGQPVTLPIEAVIRRTHQLFERIALRGAQQQGLVAEVRYADLLDKVAKIVSPTYLGDMLEHPELWERPDERIAQVQASLADVEQQIITNIRQVNSSSDLDFQVAMNAMAAITQNDEFTHLYTTA